MMNLVQPSHDTQCSPVVTGARVAVVKAFRSFVSLTRNCFPKFRFINWLTMESPGSILHGLAALTCSLFFIGISSVLSHTCGLLTYFKENNAIAGKSWLRQRPLDIPKQIRVQVLTLKQEKRKNVTRWVLSWMHIHSQTHVMGTSMNAPHIGEHTVHLYMQKIPR